MTAFAYDRGPSIPAGLYFKPARVQPAVLRSGPYPVRTKGGPVRVRADGLTRTRAGLQFGSRQNYLKIIETYLKVDKTTSKTWEIH